MVKADPGGWIMLLVPLIISMIVLVIVVGILQLIPIIGQLLGMVLGLVISPVVFATAAAFLQKARTGQAPDMMTILKSAPNYLLPSILHGLVIGAVIMLTCSLAAWVIMPLAQISMYRIVDRDANFLDAIKEAWAIYQADMGGYCVLGLFCVGAYILGFIACGVGVLAAIPVIFIANTFAYRANYE